MESCNTASNCCTNASLFCVCFTLALSLLTLGGVVLFKRIGTHARERLSAAVQKMAR